MSNVVIGSNPTLFRLHRAGLEITIRPFQPGDEDAFRTLNEQWIGKYFRVEEKHRGEGIGRALLEYAIVEARRRTQAVSRNQ
jgi:GNAT superfamily N-acetyltransferase